MTRGLSTVLDVAVCVLFVGAAAAVVSTAVPAHSPSGTSAASADAAQTVLDSTATVRVGNATRHGTVASLLADAVVVRGSPRRSPDYVAAVETVASRRLAATSAHVALTASWRPDPPCRPVAIHVGPTPRPDAPVDAVTLPVPTQNVTGCGRALVSLTVRTWSA